MNKKTLKVAMGIILVIYTGFFVLISTNYYQGEDEDKMILTNEQIKKFEDDLASGKEVTIDSYLEGNVINYSNKYSVGASKVSTGIEKLFRKTLNYVFKEISSKVAIE